MSIFKKEKQPKAKTVSEAIHMCLRIVESNDNLKFEKWGHMGEEEQVIVKQKDKKIFEIRRHIRYQCPSSYLVNGFGIYEYIRSDDKKASAEYDKASSLFKLCEAKQWDPDYRKRYRDSQKKQQSFFARLLERIRS